MSTIRYTADDDFIFLGNSQEARYFLITDDNTADYVINQVSVSTQEEAIFLISIKDHGGAYLITADNAAPRNVNVDDGLLFDFSTLTNGTLQAQGGNRADLMYGGGGADTLSGEGGDDSLVGNDGADTLTGGSGVNALYGSAGDDLLISAGSLGLDSLYGGDGDDAILVTGTWSAIDGGIGTDRLVIRAVDGAAVAAGVDSVTGIERISVRGGAEVDLSALKAATGTIRIVGPGASVIGTQGAEQIVGGGGDDRITGGGGADTLLGGGGADTFAYRAAADLGTSGTERILDFSGAGGEGDRIDLSALGITEVHKGAFAADATAQVRIVDGANGFSTLTFDFDGDGERDASLRVKSDAPLTAADFVFAAAPDAGTAVVAHQPFAELFHPVGHGVIA